MSTLEIIAREAGVSPRTVSNVLNNRNKENWGSTAQRAARIREVADRLGYKPNVMARAMATGRSRVVGLVMYPGMNDQPVDMLDGVLEEATNQGYTAKLMHLPGDGQLSHVDQIVEQCVMWKLEGLVALSLREMDMLMLLEQTAKVGCPIVYVGNIPPEKSLGVYTDARTGVRLGIQHLAQLGHRRIAYLGGPLTSPVTRGQIESFRTVMAEFDLPWNEALIAPTSWSEADVMRAGANRLMELAERPTAIFCNSLVQALTVQSVAREKGWRLPDQLSVLCYSESKVAAFADPPLTAIAQPNRTMGQSAVQHLLSHLENGDQNAELHSLCLREGIHLVVRASTAPPAAPG